MSERTAAGLSYRQGLDIVVRLLGGRGTSWAPAVLAALAVHPMRRLEILDAVNLAEQQWGQQTHQRALSKKVLDETLIQMQNNGLITCSRVRQYQPNNWYELTPMARSLLAVLRPVAEWARTRHEHTDDSPEEERPA